MSDVEKKIERSLYVNRKVIENIIANAVREADGAAGIAPAPFNPLRLLGIGSTRRIYIGKTDDVLTADVGIILSSGAKAAVTAERVQQCIKNAVQETLGMTIARVNVDICGCEI